MKKNILICTLATGLLSLPLIVQASQPVMVQNSEDLFNKVSLSAEGETIVTQDYLTLQLSGKSQGEDSKKVQEELTLKLNKAIATLKKNIKDDNFSVKTGQFSIYPEYRKDTITGWQGTATIIVEGKDFTSISSSAANVDGFIVDGAIFSVSEDTMKSIKDSTVKKAIENFKEQAQQITDNFGFGTYKIQNVNVSYNDRVPVAMYSRANVMAAAPTSMEVSAPSVNFEAGKTTVKASINGTIVMQTVMH